MERAPGSNALISSRLHSNYVLLGSILISRDMAKAEPNVSLLYRRHVPQNTLLNLDISSSKSFEREKPGTVRSMMNRTLWKTNK